MFEKTFMIWKLLWKCQKRFLDKKWYLETAHTKQFCKIFKNGVSGADLAKGSLTVPISLKGHIAYEDHHSLGSLLFFLKLYIFEDLLILNALY